MHELKPGGEEEGISVFGSRGASLHTKAFVVDGRTCFVGSFNLGRQFWAKDVIGIDVGCALLMIENYRTGRPWARFLSLPYIHTGMSKAGFRVR